MNRVLRVLNVEDSERDASLLRRHLSREGYQLVFDRVDTPAAMKAALMQQEWDVILCDCSMPHFNSEAALALLKEVGLDIPFIIISGTIGEEVAVSAMLAGAHDYMMKGDLARLRPAIDRELGETKIHKARRQAEEALQASEAELRALFEAMTDVILVFDRQGRYLRVAPTDPGYLYKPSADLIGKGVHDVLSKPEADLFVEHIHRALDEGRMHRVEYSLRMEGAQVWFDGSVSPMSNEKVLWVARDITERKRAEEEKAQLTAQIEGQRQRLNTIVANVPGVVWETWSEPDAATERIDFVSDYVETMLGYSVDEWLSAPNFWRSIVHPDDWEQIVQAAAANFASARSGRFEFRCIAKDGRVVWVESNSTVIVNRKGQALGRRGVLIDISERKQAEAALRRAEEKYRSIFEHAIEGIYQSTPAGRFTSVNPAMGRILGYASQEELIIHRAEFDSRHFVDPDSCDNLKATLAEKGVVVGFECEVFRKDLSKLWISQSIRAIRDERGNVLFHEGSVEDITERKSLEEQFRQAQKMEAVGKLAGGVAHDFNNLLTAIIGYSDMNLQHLRPGDPGRSDIEEIKKAGVRASALTRQLLAFSRKQILQPKVLDLNHTISEMHKMLQRLIGEDIQLETALDSGLGRVKADPGQVEQVLLNLAVNARDAMPDGGKVTIETANVDLDEQYARNHVTVKPSPHVMVAMSDTGCGMDKQTQAHIFEPFFTTKAVGQGTGLGLSTVYGIVKQSGGSIWVYSEVGKGTTIKIYFPRVDQEIREPDRTTVLAELPRGIETILLAEDDETVRRMTNAVLTTLGYHVLEADNGEAALLICERFDQPISLLLTDVVMPEMNGCELARRVAAMRPSVRVLYMSGYAPNAIVQHGVLDGSLSFLQKPFMPTALAQKVREVLDKPVAESMEMLSSR